MLDRRLQILSDDQRYQRLVAVARQRKMPVPDPPELRRELDQIRDGRA